MDLSCYRKFFLLFLSNLCGQQSNLVRCYNDTLVYSTSRFPIYFKCLLICSYLVHCESNCVFTYWKLLELGAISLTAELPGFLVYQLHIEGNVLSLPLHREICRVI